MERLMQGSEGSAAGLERQGALTFGPEAAGETQDPTRVGPVTEAKLRLRQEVARLVPQASPEQVEQVVAQLPQPVSGEHLPAHVEAAVQALSRATSTPTRGAEATAGIPAPSPSASSGQILPGQPGAGGSSLPGSAGALNHPDYPPPGSEGGPDMEPLMRLRDKLRRLGDQFAALQEEIDGLERELR
ncbi:MAG TPA: hypothetical protein VHN78_15065, partial [Chloroflexota bacterium]|nr:hypothetical protein [Chloroflexota bacterium]